VRRAALDVIAAFAALFLPELSIGCGRQKPLRLAVVSHAALNESLVLLSTPRR
jgi:hypothetical protein